MKRAKKVRRRGVVLVFRDRRREWRWTATASNGRIVATCGEGYRRRQHAIEQALIERAAREFAIAVSD